MSYAIVNIQTAVETGQLLKNLVTQMRRDDTQTLMKSMRVIQLTLTLNLNRKKVFTEGTTKEKKSFQGMDMHLIVISMVLMGKIQVTNRKNKLNLC